MSKLHTIKAKEGSVSFLFGVRFIALLQRSLGIANLEEIGERLTKPTFDDIAKILFCAHENACFFNRKDLVIENSDFMLYFIDDIGLEKVMQIVSEGVGEMMSVVGSNAKPTKKKAAPV